MGSQLGWFFVVLGAGAALVAAGAWAVRLEPNSRCGMRLARVAGHWVIALAALCLLILLLKVHAYNSADARLVALLAETRSSGLISVFSFVTTMGDVVPTLLIATALAMALYWRTGGWGRALVLPLVILVEVGLQFSIAQLFNPPVLANIDPVLSVGGAGPIPSGSVARLFATFFIAAYLWHDHDSSVGRRLRLTGAIITLVELVSRLYLGRHFVSDIAGGLLLGVLLVSSFAWCIELASARSARPAPKVDYASSSPSSRST